MSETPQSPPLARDRPISDRMARQLAERCALTVTLANAVMRDLERQGIYVHGDAGKLTYAHEGRIYTATLTVTEGQP